MTRPAPVWLFDLDNTLHNASHAALPGVSAAMGTYIERELGLTTGQADALRRHYWQRYGATLLGLVRHHGVDAAHFLHDTHQLPGLEGLVHGHAHDIAALRALRGRKVLLTNAPLAYAQRVLGVLGLARFFDAVVAVEDMWMFGHLRPKPDARMFKRLAARLRVHPSRCVLVEDALENLKGARRAGMQTLWVQRWTRRATWGVAAGMRVTMRPAYVDRRIIGLAAVRRIVWR
jgi:putative hydrolase of the HAD superfamily